MPMDRGTEVTTDRLRPRAALPHHRRRRVHRLAPRRRAGRARRPRHGARRPQHRQPRRTSSTCSDAEAVEFVEGSTRDEALVDELVQSTRRSCFHLASAVGVQLIVDRPLESLLKNVRGTDNVLSAAARHERTVALHLDLRGLRQELDRRAQRGLGPHPRLAVQVALGLRDREGLRRVARPRAVPGDTARTMIIVRLFNTVGPRQTGMYGMVLPALRPPGARGRGPHRVRQRHADALLRARRTTRCRRSCSCCEHPDAVGEGVQRRRGPTRSPIIELARRVIERCGSESRIQLVPYEEAYGEGFEELGRRKPDTTALRELTGWAPTRTVDDAIDDVILHEQSRLSQVGSAPRLPLEARLLTGLALAVAMVYWATPVAIRVAAPARRSTTGRSGYKAHAAPTPYLGGAAVVLRLPRRRRARCRATGSGRCRSSPAWSCSGVVGTRRRPAHRHAARARRRRARPRGAALERRPRLGPRRWARASTCSSPRSGSSPSSTRSTCSTTWTARPRRWRRRRRRARDASASPTATRGWRSRGGPLRRLRSASCRTTWPRRRASSSATAAACRSGSPSRRWR